MKDPNKAHSELIITRKLKKHWCIQQRNKIGRKLEPTGKSAEYGYMKKTSENNSNYNDIITKTTL